MITLKEAVNLFRVTDERVIYFCNSVSVEQDKMGRWPMTGKEIREKYDMENTAVTAVLPHFCMGKFKGFCFAQQHCYRNNEINPMITLKEAFKLCRVDDEEYIFLCDSIEKERYRSFPITGKRVREKYDMKNTMVTAIIPHIRFALFAGFCFII